MNIAIKHLFNFETLKGPRLNELTAYIYNTDCLQNQHHSGECRQLLLVITFYYRIK